MLEASFPQTDPAAPMEGQAAAGPGQTPFPTRDSTPSGPVSRKALCLWLPTFELRLELVRSSELDDTSSALLLPEGSGREAIWQVSERAWEAGVRPGMTVSRAVGLCPSLALLEPDPDHYDSAMEEVLEALTGVSPVLEAAGRGRVFVGMDGLDRLHGGPRTQIERVFDALFEVLPRPLVAATRAGYAPGTFGAWVAAVAALPGRPTVVDEEGLPGFLARCPVTSLPVEEGMIRRLERLGAERLEDLRRIPESALVRSFGPDGRRARAWASGRRIDPVRSRHRPRPLRGVLDLPEPTGREEALHVSLKRLLERVLARPERRGRSVRKVRLGARLEGGGSWRVEAVLRRPSGQVEDLAFPLRSRMALSPPPRAVTGLVVELLEFGAPAFQEGFLSPEDDGRGRAGRHDPLLEGQATPALREAVRELRLRLGHAPLYRVVELDPWARIPERRYALMSFDP